MTAHAPRRPPLLAVVALSTCVGLIGGALAAWAIYARFGPVERVITQPITVSGGSSGSGPTVIQLAQQVGASVVEISTRPVTAQTLIAGDTGIVDGFVASGDGLIVTSIHAIRGATALRVTTEDGHAFAATIVRADPAHGIAILRAVGAQNLTALAFAGTTANVGDLAIAVAHAPPGALTLSTGTVSSTGRTLSLPDGEPQLSNVLSVDATADPRKDGAPLVSGAGVVIGVVVDAGGAVPGLAALSGRDAAALVQLASGGATSGSATLGAAALILDRATAAAAMLPQGGLILSVDAGGPASVAGLVQGDVVTAVNGVAVDAGHPFDAVALGLAVDQQVTLTVVRGGATKTIALTVGSTSPSAQS